MDHKLNDTDLATILQPKWLLGWKAFVTNATPNQLSLQAAVLCYRHEYRVERIFNRLKSRVHIAPLFVKLNEQIEGLTYLLTLGVRV
jgi:transposase